MNNKVKAGRPKKLDAMAVEEKKYFAKKCILTAVKLRLSKMKKNIKVKSGTQAFCFSCRNVVKINHVQFLDELNDAGCWTKCCKCSK